MKPRLTLVVLGLLGLAMMSLGLQAQDRPKTTGPEKDEIRTSEQQLMRQFGEFQDSLLRLKQRMSRGTPEERKRAEALGKVLDEIKNLAINQEFLKMIELMRTVNLKNLNDIKIAQEQSGTIAKKLRDILDQLQDSKTNLSEDVQRLKQILKKLEIELTKEKVNLELTRRGKTGAPELKDLQASNTKGTKNVKDDVEGLLNKDKKGGPGGEAKNEKGENKDGGKGNGKKGEAKNDGKKSGEGAKGEAKNDGSKNPKESKGGQGSAKPQEKAGQPKSSEGGEPKAGSKSGEPKGQQGSPSPGSKKDGGAKGDQGAAKKSSGGDKGEKKAGGAKDAGAKSPGSKKDGSQGAAKGGDKKAGGGEGSKQKSPDSQAKGGGGEGKAGGGPQPKTAPNPDKNGAEKAGEGKAGGDAKGGQGAQGETKPGNSKSGQGQAKAGGASAAGGGGSPSPPSSAKGDGAPPPPSAGNPPSKKDAEMANVAKKLQEAGYDQKSAEKALDKVQREIAAKNQADAIKKMEAAKKRLEELLRQMREEEIERVLAALLARCEKMLIMQKQVLLGTRDTDAAIKRNADKKPDRNNRIDSLKLSDREKEIVQEANKCISILEAEGTAVAFPEAFQQLRQDMMHVQKRLEVIDVHDLTQDIEKDIIVQLEEMIAALKKAQEKPDPDAGKPSDGKSGKPADPKLLELVQELKMIRALQKRVNVRTTTYGRRFEGHEQAADPQIVRELRILADRQQHIQEIVRRIANGDNK